MASLAKCLEVDPAAFNFPAGLELVIEAFLTTVGEVPKLAIEFFTKGPKVLLEAFVGNMSPELPSFKASIPGIGDIEFKGRSVNAGFDIPIFDPEGLITLITGLVKILVKLPELVVDKNTKLPKIPTLKGVFDIVTEALGLPKPPILKVEFTSKFVGCLVPAILDKLTPG